MRKVVVVTMMAALVVGLVLAVLACGGQDIAGTYKAEGDDPEFQNAELVMHDDETFELTATVPGSDQELSFKGTWALDGDKITLKAEGIGETEGGKVQDGKLVFDEVTWVKQ